MATRPLSRLKGDPWRAYEALPAAVRVALQEALVDWCPLRAREWLLHLVRERRLTPAQAEFALVQTIRRHDHAEVAAFARAWPKGARAYPHLAAGATIQRYAGADGMPDALPLPVAARPKPAPAPKPAPKRQPRGAPKPKRARLSGKRRARGR